MLSKLSLCESGDLRFLLRQELRIPADDRHLGPHGGEEVTELCRNVPSTYDRHAFRQFLQLHPYDRVAGVIVDLVKPLDRGDYGPRPAPQEDHLSCDRLTLHLQRVGRNEFCTSMIVIYVLGCGQTLSNRIDVPVDERPHPLHYLLVTHIFYFNFDAKLFRLLHRPDKLSRIDHYLGWDAPPRQADSSRFVLVYDCDLDLGILLNHWVDDVHR